MHLSPTLTRHSNTCVRPHDVLKLAHRLGCWTVIKPICFLGACWQMLTRSWFNFVLTFGQCLRHWPNVKITLVGRRLFTDCSMWRKRTDKIHNISWRKFSAHPSACCHSNRIGCHGSWHFPRQMSPAARGRHVQEISAGVVFVPARKQGRLFSVTETIGAAPAEEWGSHPSHTGV